MLSNPLADAVLSCLRPGGTPRAVPLGQMPAPELVKQQPLPLSPRQVETMPAPELVKKDPGATTNPVQMPPACTTCGTEDPEDAGTPGVCVDRVEDAAAPPAPGGGDGDGGDAEAPILFRIGDGSAAVVRWDSGYAIAGALLIGLLLHAAITDEEPADRKQQK